MIKLSIVVPCYNEEKNIPLILKRFSDVIDRDDIEVILVNNGSTDSSQKVMEELIPNYKFVKLVEVKKNRGYGYGILQGLNEAKGDYLGWTHADMQTDPYDVIKAFNILLNSSDKNIYVKGNRKNRPLFDQFFTIGMSVFETVYLKSKLWEINAQPNLFTKTFYKSWTNPPHDFSLDLYALHMANLKGVKVIRFDVIFPERVHGTSSWNDGVASKWKFIKRTLEFSTKLKKGGL